MNNSTVRTIILCAVVSVMLGPHLLRDAIAAGPFAETAFVSSVGSNVAGDAALALRDRVVGSTSHEKAEASTCTTEVYDVTFNGALACTLDEQGPYTTHYLNFTECTEIVFRTASGELNAIPAGGPDCPTSRDPERGSAESVSAIYNPSSQCTHSFKLTTATPSCKIVITVNPV